jgi:hypothetical protein
MPTFDDESLVAGTIVVYATKKVCLRCVKGYNKAKPIPKPIMQIYPKDGIRWWGQRLILPKGSRIVVYAELVSGDSNLKFWKVISTFRPDLKTEFFVRADEVKKAG